MLSIVGVSEECLGVHWGAFPFFLPRLMPPDLWVDAQIAGSKALAITDYAVLRKDGQSINGEPSSVGTG